MLMQQGHTAFYVDIEHDGGHLKVKGICFQFSGKAPAVAIELYGPELDNSGVVLYWQIWSGIMHGSLPIYV